jgi:hypothetical protein
VPESPCSRFMLRTRPDGTPDRQGSIRAEALPLYGVSTKVRPIRLFWIQATLHSRTDASFAMTRRKRWGTNAGFSTSMAARCWSGQSGRCGAVTGEPVDSRNLQYLGSRYHFTGAMGRAFLFMRRCPAYRQASVPRVQRVAFPVQTERRRDARQKRTCAKGKTPCSRSSIAGRV